MAHSHKYTSVADRLGITSAIICAVHCLVIPAIFLLKYSLADTVGQGVGQVAWRAGLPYWWEALDYVFLIVGFIAVYHASSHAPARGIRLALWIFWIVLAIAVIFESQLHWMAYIASAGLIITHFINIKKHRIVK